MQKFHFFTERMSTPTGPMLIATDEFQSVRALDWVDHETRLHRLLRLHYGEGCVRLEANSSRSEARSALEAYFDGALAAIETIKVETGGTEFQREVWSALRTIPPGKTTSYGRLALRLGRPKAVRAVGLANGANPVAIVAPCHRVIGANAAMTGYGGGIERKIWLLTHENAVLN